MLCLLQDRPWHVQAPSGQWCSQRIQLHTPRAQDMTSPHAHESDCVAKPLVRHSCCGVLALKLVSVCARLSRNIHGHLQQLVGWLTADAP